MRTNEKQNQDTMFSNQTKWCVCKANYAQYGREYTRVIVDPDRHHLCRLCFNTMADAGCRNCPVCRRKIVKPTWYRDLTTAADGQIVIDLTDSANEDDGWAVNPVQVKDNSYFVKDIDGKKRGWLDGIKRTFYLIGSREHEPEANF